MAQLRCLVHISSQVPRLAIAPGLHTSGGGEGDGGGGESGGGDGGGDGIEKIALLEPSPLAVMPPLQAESLISMAPPFWSYAAWKTVPAPESGACVALVAMVPKQTVLP